MRIKRLIPSIAQHIIRKLFLRNEIFKSYYKDALIYLKYSNVFKVSNTQEKLLSSLIRQYHVIEKGITMPDRRFGFGQERIINLANDCLLYAKRFDKSHEQFIICLKVLAEYRQLHEENNYKLDDSLQISINKALALVEGVVADNQIQTTKELYFSHASANFENFSNSRHSLRHFEGPIDNELIMKAIELAQNAPSSCNRQSSRVYFVQDKETIKKLLEIQHGNRGFGHLADKLLVITSELGGYIPPRERNSVYIDGGIYALNLLYSLHYYQIGACALNASFNYKEDILFRKILNIPVSERFILIIACGAPAASLSLTNSKRSDFHSICKII